MPGITQGMGQQNGDVHVGATQIAEIKAWQFTPTQTLGKVVTNATLGFEGQIMGAMGGSGSVTIVVPRTGYSAPIQAFATPTLNLYADAARLHGYTQMPVCFERAPTNINLSGPDGIEITINFKATGPYNSTGAFNVLGPYNNLVTSSSGQ